MNLSDVTCTKIRATLATMEGEIASLPGGAPDLRASYAELVKQLALGAEPETRECPTCKHMGMRKATRNASLASCAPK